MTERRSGKERRVPSACISLNEQRRRALLSRRGHTLRSGSDRRSGAARPKGAERWVTDAEVDAVCAEAVEGGVSASAGSLVERLAARWVPVALGHDPDHTARFFLLAIADELEAESKACVGKLVGRGGYSDGLVLSAAATYLRTEAER